MKRTAVISLFIFSCLFMKAQVMPEAFIGMWPSVPGNACSEDTNGRGKFTSELSEVIDKLDQEMNRRHEETKAKVDANKSKMQENALKKTGVSPELTQKMMALQEQKKNAKSKEQKDAIEKQMKALTDQMMQESMNMSMGEVQNLKTMDKAGKTAWATAYSTEKKAEVMAEPEKYQEQNAKNMNDYNLVKEQKRLNDSLGAQQAKYARQFMALDNDSTGKAILKNISDLEAKLDTLEATEDCKCEDQKNSLRHSIREQQKNYCNLLSPRYAEILHRYETFTKAAIQPLYRLEKLTQQVTAMQTGVDLKLEPGELGLGQIHSYLAALINFDKYNNIGPPVVYIGSE
jgi:hypothetical protein